MSREPISEERLDALRTMDIAALVPQSAHWNEATREQMAKLLDLLAPVIRELLDEIDELDADLDVADRDAERAVRERDTALDELERLVPDRPKRRPAISAIHRERVGEHQWRVRWREDGKSRQRTFDRPSDARGFSEDLMRRRYRDRGL